MSDHKHFDEHMKQSLGGYSPEVPPHIWDNITAGRKKKRPVAFWLNNKNLLVLAALLLLGSIAGLLILQQKDSNSIALEANDSSRQQGAEKAVPPAVVKSTNDENEQGGNSTVSQIENKENSDIKPATVVADNTATGSGKTGVPKKNAAGKRGDGRLSIADKTNTDNANNLFRNKDKKEFLKRSATKGSQRVGLADGVVAFDQPGNAIINKDPLQEEFYLVGLPGGRERISIASLADWDKKQTIIKAIQIPDCPTAEKDAAGNKSYFEVYLGPDYAIKKYSDTGNSSLVEKRKESLRFQSAYSAGVRYTRVFGNGMSIRAGINYSQINEKFSFIKDNVVQLVYVISPAGDTTDRYYVRGTRYKNSYNHYRTIDVPIVIGYELGNGRLHANINAGVMLNVYSWQKGETLDNNYMPVSITTGKEGDAAYQYKTNLGIGFTSAISLYYKLNDRLHLLAEPYCRFNLSPMNKEAVSLQEKFTTIGLRLGLRVDF